MQNRVETNKIRRQMKKGKKIEQKPVSLNVVYAGEFNFYKINKFASKFICAHEATEHVLSETSCNQEIKFHCFDRAQLAL